MIFQPGSVPDPHSPSVYIFVCENNILFVDAHPGEPLSANEAAIHDVDLDSAHYIGVYRRQNCYVLQVTEAQIEPAAALGYSTLRALLGVVSDQHFQMLGRALQITRWHGDHRFCGSCGGQTRIATIERARVCDRCDKRYFPRISPCVICLVTRNGKLLLARHARHKEKLFTTLAGFIEAGESAEEAIQREIREEVAIEVKNIQYVGSQAWPFPGQLMLGFTAEYLRGEIQPDGEEILEAHWFDIEDLPLVPPPGTIAAQLIRRFIEEKGKALQ